MKHSLIILTVFFSVAAPLSAQSDWELRKEEDGIRVYTREMANSNFQAFRGETEIEASFQDVIGALLDVAGYKEWMPDTKKVEVLEEKSETEIIYYVATSVPWPVSDRDGVYSLKLEYDPNGPSASIVVKALPDYLENKKGHVRVQKSDTYYQIKTLAPNRVHVDYEVAAEPGGSVPSWLVKMKVVSIPFESMEALAGRAKSGLYKDREFEFMEN
jgi:hypothetical protein